MTNEDFKYLVCTCCFTYNQSLFIKDALDGFVLQSTTFPVVYVIVDDASTDGTPDVISQYMSDNFDNNSKDAYEIEKGYGYLSYAQHKKNRNCFFATLFLKENHHGKKPKEPYLMEWTNNSKYLAICEGDDYWTDESKLQRQADFLESHPECSALGENGIELNIIDGTQKLFSEEPARYVTVEELIEERKFPTASVLYRKDALDERFGRIKYKFDTMIWCYLAFKGKFYYDAIISSVYRRGAGMTVTVDPYAYSKLCESWYLELQSVFPQHLSKKNMKRIIIRSYIGAANKYIKKKTLSVGLFCSYKKAFILSPRLFIYQFVVQYYAALKRLAGKIS